MSVIKILNLFAELVAKWLLKAFISSTIAYHCLPLHDVIYDLGPWLAKKKFH